MFDLNFIAFAINDEKKGLNYEDFLIPFTFFALLHNENSHVEIIVLNPDNFKQKYKKELELINNINNNYLIRKPQYQLNKHIPNTYRFFEVPTVKSTYTYITDIDIMYLENILPKYLDTWSQIHLPYHNILRSPVSNRLTGVMMVKNEKYYTSAFKKCQKKYYNNFDPGSKNDEVILGNMCRDIHGLPDSNFKYRPIFGIHFSPNRGPTKRMALNTPKEYKDKFLEISQKYKNLFTYPIFKKLVNRLNDKFNIRIPKIKQTSNDDQDKQTSNDDQDKQV
jgi:hypothetical protein